LTVNNSTISGNSISNQGGGIYNNNNASLTVTNSTISGNSAGFAGGGIYNNSGILTLSNSTLTGNSVYKGGALYNRGGSTATITNSTFSGNTATRSGGGGGIYNDAILNIANTIIANSTKGGDYNGGAGGTVNLISPSTAANNLVSSGSFSWATTKTSAEINLGPLANNGGPTKTIALGTGSLAIGAGDATISNAAPVNGLDQRGVTRSTTAPSIGAFEFYPATQVTLTTTAAGSASGSAFTTQPVITIRDSLGNPVNTTASVTMTVSGNGTTVGTTTVNAVAGVATFTNVGISGTAGTAYTLTFASNGLTSATQSITPLGAANTPTFGTPTATADGFTVLISNYDANFTYGGTATANGTVSIDGSGLVTVSGVAANTSSTATITTTQTNFVSGSAQVTATSLNAANTPTFGAPTSTPDGFTVQISNYDANFTYAGTATVGSVSISGTGLVTVTGLAANTSSTATITTTQTNFVSGSAPVTATSLAPTAPLVVGTPASTSSGGSSTVTLYDPVTGAEAGTAVPFPGFSGPVKVVSGDFNNDGVADIVAGAGFGGGPAIAILDSQTGEVMEAFFAFDAAFTGGVFVAVQDVNNDG
ncbi:MAG: choice-of-anchor Q domain-containing protein, partial [Gemmataceae bacterium]